MAKNSDISISDVQITFSNEVFRIPFKLSSGQIDKITYAEVIITVQNRLRAGAVGTGGILLSDLWAFPGTNLTHEEKDTMMRSLMFKMKEALLSLTEFMDPFQIAHHMDQQIQHLSTEIPLLASLVCWSSFDAALHDGWAKAAGLNAYDMYSADFLDDDLGHYLGAKFKGLYPAHFLNSRPKERLWVQHVVGAGDPLLKKDIVERPNDGLPLSLDEWIEKEGVSWFKLKIKGTDVAWDLSRIIDVYKVAEETLQKCGIKHPIRMEVDSNEACPTPEPAIEFLRKLKEISPTVFSALQYVEQPTPRKLADYKYTLHEISKYKPVLVDESLDDLNNLQLIESQGWSGVALKTCKGHTHALLVYCWARQRNLFITVQDLTNPGLALVHSAGFCSRLSMSIDAFEYNSRQYIPASRKEVQITYPGIFRVSGGQISLDSLSGIGLY